jgi:hypothetical protein
VFLAAALAREFLRQRRPLLAAGAVACQAAKTGADLFAVASGLDYRILRHRAQRVSPEEERAWGEVWRSVQGGRDGKAAP